jgi:hypothetical protein
MFAKYNICNNTNSLEYVSHKANRTDSRRLLCDAERGEQQDNVIRDESALMAAVTSIGPIAVSIQVINSFQNYKSGTSTGFQFLKLPRHLCNLREKNFLLKNKYKKT